MANNLHLELQPINRIELVAPRTAYALDEFELSNKHGILSNHGLLTIKIPWFFDCKNINQAFRYEARYHTLISKERLESSRKLCEIIRSILHKTYLQTN